MSEAQGFRWSAEMVAADLVQAFRVLPTMPVYSPRKSEHYPALRGQDGTSLDLVAVSERVLGRRSPERLALLVWARSKATRGDVGGSVRAYCVEAGTNVQTFNRQRKRACARIAADLNRLADETMAALLALGRAALEVPDAVDAAGGPRTRKSPAAMKQQGPS